MESDAFCRPLWNGPSRVLLRDHRLANTGRCPVSPDGLGRAFRDVLSHRITKRQSDRQVLASSTMLSSFPPLFSAVFTLSLRGKDDTILLLLRRC